MRILLALFSALILGCPALAQQTQSSLDAEINAQLPSNNRNQIAAFNLRKVLHDLNAAIPSGPNFVSNLLLAQMPANTVKCNNTGSTANAADCTSIVVAGATLNPTALNRGLLVNQTTAGTSATATSFNLIDITNDVATITGANFGVALNVVDILNGSTAQGGREAIQGYMQLAAPTNASNLNRNYVGIEGIGTATAGDGGTNTGAGALGAIFGMSAWGDAQSGATDLLDVAGMEINFSLRTGSSAKIKEGLAVVEHALDAVAGASVDTSVAISGQSGAPGTADGILFTDAHGQHAVASSGTLIATTGGTFAGGVDLSASTLTTAFKSPGFSVDGSGNVFGQNQLYLVGSVKNINANSANTDNQINITLPPGAVKWTPFRVVIYNHGTTASLTTATWGVFTGTGGTGITINGAGGALSGLTATGVNTVGNGINNTATTQVVLDNTITSLQFRIGTAQGAAATIDAYVYAMMVP